MRVYIYIYTYAYMHIHVYICKLYNKCDTRLHRLRALIETVESTIFAMYIFEFESLDIMPTVCWWMHTCSAHE